MDFEYNSTPTAKYCFYKNIKYSKRMYGIMILISDLLQWVREIT